MSRPPSLIFLRLPWLTLLLGLLLAGRAPAGPVPATTDEEPYLPGLVASFQGADGKAVSRIDHELAFDWGECPPDPRLAGGAFAATWQGNLYVDAPGDYRFHVLGSGEVEVKVAGRVAVARQQAGNAWGESAPVKLPGEFVSFELSYRRTEKHARVQVFWAGPQFGPEPIPPRLLFHPRERTLGRDFERGELLARVLRCAGCHEKEPQSQPAPALEHLGGNLARDWLVGWLVAGEHARTEEHGAKDQAELVSPRRMPAFGLSDAQAAAIADWLLTSRQPKPRTPAPAREKSRPAPTATGSKPKPSNKQGKGAPAKPRPNARTGERLFLTLGCLACHTWRDLGASGWLGGGDLTHIADKRPAAYFADWLTDPGRLNRDHRMPEFALSDDERTSLALFLAEQKKEGAAPSFAARPSTDPGAEGMKLVDEFRCAACHRLPKTAARVASAPPKARALGTHSNWDDSCLGTPDNGIHRPGYRLGAKDARALRLYYSKRRSPAAPTGRHMLVEHNCLACHAREGTREAIPLLPPLLADKLTAVASRFPDLAPLVPGLTPPSLNSVGDKLTDQALAESIARHGNPHRPYLNVRMPRFPLRDQELQALAHYLAATDRMPERAANPPVAAARSRQDRYVLAGGRLVSSDGFGCTSCHQVGKVQPPPGPLNARGPDLSQLDRRIRRTWFDRWVRNPARIVPRMEMPSVQLAVRGVLDDKLNDQLAAVWHVLNLPGFEPPLPNPIRTLRHLGSDGTGEPHVLTDVLQRGGKVLTKPFLVGLANRQNVLFDLETAALSQWTVGDTARQRTKGKTWFWEVAGTPVLDPGLTGPDLSLVIKGVEMHAQPSGQFVTEADSWKTEGSDLEVHYRLHFAVPSPGSAATRDVTLHVGRRLYPLTTDQAGAAKGFAQEVRVSASVAAQVRLHVLSPEAAGKTTLTPDERTLRLGDSFASRISLKEPAGARFSADRTAVLLTPNKTGSARAVLHYESEIPVDHFPELPPAPVAVRKGEPVEIAPGFTGERLPLPLEIMPTGLAWRPDGRLVFASLRGQVLEAVDTDGDGSEDQVTPLADGLPAPYGVYAAAESVDVAAKYGLLRVRLLRSGGRRVETIASGWGYTPDYHDWVVGLPRNEGGDYFVGIPCEQDKRAPAAARFHGSILRLAPRMPTPDNPRRYILEPVSAGHRFPMGLAFNRHGELFVTDNQGNYNPFNELNHVRKGVHFGFINSLERNQPAPPLTPPAIDIPHPWTRSVNGICFLDTPKALRAKAGHDLFGPLEGHLVGCEYDTRRLVRMTLQQVGDTFQGAAYPLNILPEDPARGFLGPLVCAVSPRGELYVGSIRDSGWGAGNNVGEIVRVRIEPDKLPCGIALVRATKDGFTLDFFQPVDRSLAGRADSYTIQSYRRESTPAYGGPDLNRRTEKVARAAVREDGRRVTLKLSELRPGFVYEMRLKNLAPGAGVFHPAEAHYTLRVVPN